MSKKAKTIKRNQSRALASTAVAKKSAPPKAAVVQKAAKAEPAKKAAAPAKKPTAKNGVAALPGRYEEPLASYSPYAQHRILLEKYGTDEAGQAKVLKHGVEVLGLPETQVKTYIREKLNAILRDEQKKTGLYPGKPQIEKAARGEFEPDFKYTSKAKALAAMMGTARRVGVQERAFHILSENGKFAFVPAHVRPAGKPPQFQKGDIVMDIIIADSRAKVLEAGPEQSVIEYETERKYSPKVTAISNYYLHKVASKKAATEAPAKKKAAKKAPAKKAK